MKQETEYFILIPRKITEDRGLSDGEKLLYGEIHGLTKQKGYCYALNQHFANVLGASKSTIKRRLQALEDKGYIIRQTTIDENRQVVERRIFIKEHSNIMEKEGNHSDFSRNNTVE
ncbi:MAG: helix-turn-helix domain-containing protein [Aerococcaceae bacterium]|nr:helix-turn-helix domain-containing protein [Aerococcaceae bacterium]